MVGGYTTICVSTSACDSGTTSTAAPVDYRDGWMETYVNYFSAPDIKEILKRLHIHAWKTESPKDKYRSRKPLGLNHRQVKESARSPPLTIPHSAFRHKKAPDANSKGGFLI